MAERLQSELRPHVAVAEDPLTAVAVGAGRLSSEPARLARGDPGGRARVAEFDGVGRQPAGEV